MSCTASSVVPCALTVLAQVIEPTIQPSTHSEPDTLSEPVVVIISVTALPRQTVLVNVFTPVNVLLTLSTTTVPLPRGKHTTVSPVVAVGACNVVLTPPIDPELISFILAGAL